MVTFVYHYFLGGKSLLIILACVSLAESNYGDTLLTLQYAVDAKQMKTKLITVENPRTVEARPAGNQQLILDENQTLRNENKRLLAIKIIADTQSQLKLATREAQQTELEFQKVMDELANNMKEKCLENEAVASSAVVLGLRRGSKAPAPSTPIT
ncbi:hypothetical protein DAPPUDRAFT_117877 [Daphnia pulex]|uniref:Kinesin motor domain-containing protein n=1 Tax=Daphnia pulex TaxID=6669 RepID=E9HU10_DAPPU|nr:hypothetical protein DAPPUDRAFT_117877 [Daphnia pulex]|eukprot:EFX64766.1 hypothetical protein DAPPUDRAFT_117877 [Daphnia pulex]